MKQIVLATNNEGKAQEINTMLAPHNIDILSQKALNIASVAETGLTFVENAILKARHASRVAELPAIADDSGLEVDALDGAPGIYSARYAGDNASDHDNLQKLLLTLKDTEIRTARFCCIMVYLQHENDPTPVIAEGYWEGAILTEPAGDNGFGYDPIFFVDSYQCSAAQLPAAVKNKISHRAQALSMLLSKIEP